MATTTTALASDRPLQTLLSLCENLHGQQQDADSPAVVPSVSLRQLVPLHQSICQAVRWGSATSNTSNSKAEQDESSLESWIVRVCLDPEDQQLCREILISSSTKNTTSSSAQQKQQLAVLQYCLSSCSHPLEGLSSLVLPWLLSRYYMPLPQAEQDELSSIPQTKLEMLEALLDAVFSTPAILTNPDSLQKCTDACLQLLPSSSSSASPEWTWTVQGRVLIRLHQWTCKAKSTNDDIMAQEEGHVLQCLLQKCKQAIQQQKQQPQATSSSVYAAWLRPLTNDWLPYLLCHHNNQNNSQNNNNINNSEQLQKLWQCLWETYHHQNATTKSNTSNAIHIIIPTTSVLCAMIPSLIDKPLPVPTTNKDKITEPQTPFHQECLWKLIHTCLQQGIPRPYSSSSSSAANSYIFAKGHANDKLYTILRRRGLYLLRMIMPANKIAKEEGKKQKTKGKAKKQKQTQTKAPEDPTVLLWKKYIQVMETLEMETEQHLIEQVWDTLTEVLAACASMAETQQKQRKQVDASTGTTTTPPLMTWKWTQLLLARVLTSYDQPMVRKLALYRFLNGQAGISLSLLQPTNTGDDGAAAAARNNNNANKKEGKGKQHGKKPTSPKKPQGAPLTLLTPSFVCEIVIVSFDSLVGSVGTNLNMEEGKQVQHVELAPLLSKFINLYYQALAPDQRLEFVKLLWHNDMVNRVRTKILVQIWGCLADAMQSSTSTNATTTWVLEDPAVLPSLVQSLQRLFATASIVRTFQESLLESLATMLRHAWTLRKAVNPKLILQVLALFHSIVLDGTKKSSATTATVSAGQGEEEKNSLDENDNVIKSSYGIISAALQQWLCQIVDTVPLVVNDDSGMDLSWISLVAASVAAAFVRGDLLSTSSSGADDQALWEPKSGASKSEREMARATAYLCTLVGRSTTTREAGDSKGATTAGELLWPAIHKGLANVPVAMIGTTWTKADCVTRALLLLEEGCRLQVISGMGNGDLIVDGRTQQMMPPPRNIELELESSVKFVLHHVAFLMVEAPSKEDGAGGASRSGDAKKASITFAYLISQIRLLHEAYPSSMALSKAVDEMVKTSLDALQESHSNPGTDIVRQTALTYAALSCGAALPDEKQMLEICRLFLLLEYQKMPGRRKSEEQIARSIFFFAKWGVLSCLLPRLLGDDGKDQFDVKAVDDFLQEFRKVAFASVHGIPVDAMMAFFQCIAVTARRQLSVPERPVGNENQNEMDASDDVDPAVIGDFIDAFMTIMEERVSSHDTLYMLNEFCGIIFQRDLLLQEYRRLLQDPVAGETPIRDAFRKLMSLAGTTRPHISRVVLCHATVGWLGGSQIDASSDNPSAGLGAISFRKDIVELLLHKESRVNEVTANQSVNDDSFNQGFTIPPGIDESSVARGYALIFFSKLSDPQSGLHPDVLKDLVHHTIFGLLDKVSSDPKQKKKGSSNLVMLGSEEYVVKIRGWQALCCLSRFVTDDIAEAVCKRIFQTMADPLHQQIRYFLEVFTLQCSRRHNSIFGEAILESIKRRDLSLQHMTSVMILAGNLIVGRYRLDFLAQYEEGATGERVPLNKILAGTIPWLGSTQGFSRGIAQLLTHALIPRVVDVKADSNSSDSDAAGIDSDSLLISIYRFLDENPEMQRLRKKSATFFDSYAVDEVCSPEGILSIPVDEGGEAFPVHMTEIMKQNLQEVYEEAHEKEYPQWKYLEDTMKAKAEEEEEELGESEPVIDDALVNFQRKIIPLDELNLALESMREKRLRNVAGKKKQKLIVCASLIDKVPNLGGLARTAEIFAAEKLVIPDIGVTKMDNFKSFSVAAGDWIEIEECKEENLLMYLRSHRSKGYFIVGLEQTSSSVSLEGFTFPNQPILLLLGKEKEGIPVDFLQAVDQCLEIPQMGITRSLNVHVSGAIAIWEHTKQRLGEI